MWYRFTVDVPASTRGKRVHLYAPVVETEAWTWVNGKYVAHRPYHESYERPNEMDIDITDALKPGQRNVIAISRFDQQQSHRRSRRPDRAIVFVFAERGSGENCRCAVKRLRVLAGEQSKRDAA